MAGAQPCVAMTFDDGPDATLTPLLLSILEAKRVTATFFVVGIRATTWPAPVARAAADGFEIGNHSWDHAVLPSQTSDVALRELTRTDDVLQNIIGRTPAYVRAPYGSISVRVAGLTPRTFVAWSVDSLDWKGVGSAQITQNVVSKATSGGIILMHDTHATTINAVPGIIDGLQARGFRLVTVSELLSGRCGGSAIGFSLPGQVPPVIEPSSPPLVSSIAPKPGAPVVSTVAVAPKVAAPVVAGSPVQPAADRRYRVHDEDE